MYKVSPWTDDEKDILLTDREAKIAFLVIAEKLNRTKNSCIGMYNRLIAKNNKRALALRESAAEVDVILPDEKLGQVALFAEVLAQTGNKTRAGRYVGLNPYESDNMFRRIQRGLGHQAI